MNKIEKERRFKVRQMTGSCFGREESLAWIINLLVFGVVVYYSTKLALS